MLCYFVFCTIYVLYFLLFCVCLIVFSQVRLWFVKVVDSVFNKRCVFEVCRDPVCCRQWPSGDRGVLCLYVCCIYTAVASLWENGCRVFSCALHSVLSFIFVSLGSGLRQLWCVLCCHGFAVVSCWRIVFEYSVVLLGKTAGNLSASICDVTCSHGDSLCGCLVHLICLVVVWVWKCLWVSHMPGFGW